MITLSKKTLWWPDCKRPSRKIDPMVKLTMTSTVLPNILNIDLKKYFPI
jgi:hypothetical protein